MDEPGSLPVSAKEHSGGGSVRLEGWWKFDEGAGAVATDRSGGGHSLTAQGEPSWTNGVPFGGAVTIGEVAQSWASSGPVLRTDQNFSVAAWVRLDSQLMKGDVRLPPGEFAMTAVGQVGDSHSAFYLGARLIPPERHGTIGHVLRWSFTVAPVDGSMTGPVEWEHASTGAIEQTTLDQWVLLVGAYNLEGRTARIYVPSINGEGAATLPGHWPCWNADESLTIGCGRYLDQVADLWRGSVGPVRAYSGVLSAEDAASLYAEDELTSRPAE